MSDRSTTSKREPAVRGRVVRSHREMELLAGGALAIEDTLEIEGTAELTFTMCDVWLLELFELEAGDLAYRRGETWVRPAGSRFGVFYPPFSIMRTRLVDVRGRWAGLAARDALPGSLTQGPIVFETDCTRAPRSAADVERLLASSRARQRIEAAPDPSLLSIRAKRLIDKNYSVHPSIARIAARLGVSHPHLSRCFKRDFGISPNAYSQSLRIAEATFRLARGEEIVDVSLEVGFNDLSRFYKQFNKATTRTPGDCRTPRRRKR